jgi:hypothetical protein
VIWLDLQVDVAREFAITDQVELRSNQWRSQQRADDAAFAIESLVDLGSDAIGVRTFFREPVRQGSDYVAIARQSCNLVLDGLDLRCRARG